MKKTTLTNEMMDNILLMCQKGISQAAAANILGVSDSTVSRCIIVYDAVKKGLPITGTLASSTNIIRWACDKLGKPYNAIVGQEQKQEESKSTEPDNQSVELIVEAIAKLESAIDSIDKRLSAMQMTVQSLRSECGEGVKRVAEAIGEQTKKIVETINVNGDIATKERDKLADKLEAVKMNTRSLRKSGGA